MPAYIIARINVTDPVQYELYKAATPPAIEQFGGRFIVRGGKSVTLEGPEVTHRTIILEFPSLERAEAFYNSDAYQAAIKLRENAAEASLIAFDGV